MNSTIYAYWITHRGRGNLDRPVIDNVHPATDAMLAYTGNWFMVYEGDDEEEANRLLYEIADENTDER